jgi:hypothetical protein
MATESRREDWDEVWRHLELVESEFLDADADFSARVDADNLMPQTVLRVSREFESARARLRWIKTTIANRTQTNA